MSPVAARGAGTIAPALASGRMVGDVHPVRRLAAQRPARLALELSICLIVLLCAGLAIGAGIGDLETDQLRFMPAWFVLAIVGFVALQLAHVELWRLQLHRLGSDVPPRRARAIWCASALARYVPTSLLMPTLRITMSEKAGVPKRRTLASLVYEAALAVAGALVVAGYFVIQLPELEGKPVRWVAVGIGLATLVLLHPRIFGPMSAAVLRRLRREPLAVLLPESTLLALWAGYALSFVLAGLSLFALAAALYPVGAADLPQVAGAFAVGFSVSVLAFVLPGGLGAREAGLSAALAPVMPTVIAIAVAVVVRIVQIGIELVLAAVTQAAARREELAARNAAAASVAARGIHSASREREPQHAQSSS
jgi:hypothetical protein